MSDGGERTSVIPRPQSALGAIIEIVVIVIAAIALALGIQAIAVKPYQIPSGSMEPTLDIGQRVLVNRLSHHLGSDPSIGDVVVFHPPASATGGNGPDCTVPKGDGQVCPMNDPHEADDSFIKRVVATPGDTLEVDNGIPIVNGKPVEGDWTIRPCAPASGVGCNFRDPITIPPDHYFMMGDNRGHSDDSRFWGPVPRDWIVGKAVITYWPPDRIGFL
jgi:signal peptidase I